MRVRGLATERAGSVGARARLLFDGLRDLLWPDLCLGCELSPCLDGQMFCLRCRSRFEPVVDGRLCRWCGRGLIEASGEGHGAEWPCQDCEEHRLSFGFPVSLGSYRDSGGSAAGSWQDLILGFKRSPQPWKARALGESLAKRLRTIEWGRRIDLVVPIPARRKRVGRESPFRGSVALAREVARGLGLSSHPRGLRFCRLTTPQKTLPVADRLANVRGAMVCRHPNLVLGKRVLLVDDVLTTGSTLEEAHRALSECRPSWVRGAVLARSHREELRG